MSPTSIDPKLIDEFIDFEFFSKDISDLCLMVALVNLRNLLSSTSEFTANVAP